MYVKIGQHKLATASPDRTESCKQESRHSLSAITFPWSCLWISSLHVFFSSSFRLLRVFRLEIWWKKHGGFLLPLLLMLQGGRAMQIILEQEMWHGGRENHKQFCRNIAWKHFNNSLGFYYLSKILKGTKLIHLAQRKEWLLQNTITSRYDISSHPFSILVT